MGTPITLSGFNNIDFNLILNAIMEQERAPITQLEFDRNDLEGQDFEYGLLATKLADLEQAVGQLSTTESFGTRALANSNTSAVSASVGSTTPLGTYDVVVQSLARAQVTASSSTHPDADTTIVADGGTLDIGGITVTIAGDVTLQDLANAINDTTDIPATASVMQTSPGAYQLVLTGNDAGATNAFAITNSLQLGGGSSTVAFAGNAVEASDAAATINNIAVTSTSNTIDGAAPGMSISLLEADPAETVTLTVTRDDAELKTRIDDFVTAYNALISYVDSQFAASAEGTGSSIGGDGLLRGLRTSLRSTVSGAYAVGGTYSYLAEVGIGSNRAGELTVDTALLDDALASNIDDVEALLVGAGGASGAFAALETTLTAYTEGGGLVPSVQERIDDQIAAIDNRIGRLEEQLLIRRASLEAEFIAADLAISQLNSQLDSLGALGTGFRLF